MTGDWDHAPSEVGFKQPAQGCVYGSGLAGTAGAEKAKNLTAPRRETDTVQRRANSPKRFTSASATTACCPPLGSLSMPLPFLPSTAPEKRRDLQW